MGHKESVLMDLVISALTVPVVEKGLGRRAKQGVRCNRLWQGS